MPLRRPDFFINDVCDWAEEGDLLYDVFKKERGEKGGFGYGVTPLLLFPGALGTVHVGEVFRGYVSLRNLTGSPLRNIRIKGGVGRAELQRFDL